MTAVQADLVKASRALAASDPALKPVIADIGPCGPIRRDVPPFELLCWIIANQQLSTRAAARIHERVKQTLGAGCSPEVARACTPPELRAAGLSLPKARAVIQIAEQVCQGQFAFPQLETLDDPAVKRRLCKLPCVGVWSAEMYLLFGLGRMDVFAPSDLGLRQAIRRLDGLDGMPSHAHCSLRAERWRPYRSIAAWYLWRWQEATPAH